MCAPERANTSKRRARTPSPPPLALERSAGPRATCLVWQVRIRAGRPDWDSEYKELAGIYGRADIGVIFCGAPMIAAALKSSCEKLSNKEKTVFRLHKENF